MFQQITSLTDGYPLTRSGSTSGGLTLYISLVGVADFYHQIKSAAPVVKELHKTVYGADKFAIQDSNGYVLTFAETTN